MNKLVTSILLFLFPALVLADGSLSFAPPPQDYSVVFLGNLFGVVDGVLSGTGSQIMGAMFAVFNSAVLALGGIVIMYTLMVSTMNTAHEGQMLGQKWSSIWIPVRSTMGLALLIPKASGYCLMQIFVMWIVVQGVGAADKVWEAALGYLNRGGVIIQAQTNPTTALTDPSSASSGVPYAATAILTGQVCMLGLQKQLEAQRKIYLQMKPSPCDSSTSGAITSISTLCNSAVPDLVGTVNAVSYQNDAVTNDKSVSDFSLPMPNPIKGSPYYNLKGICGTIHWNAIKDASGNNINKTTSSTGSNSTVAGVNGITASQLETMQMSRAIGIQQMYIDLQAVAQVMVNNSPALTPSGNSSSTTNNNVSLNAREQFGVPYTASGTTCTKYGDTCVIWGPLTAGGVLFSGTEFWGAINDYNGIMAPTLNLLSASADAANANSSRAFIANATNQGWIMAGSYFFDLVFLNGNAVNNANKTDVGTGMETSTIGFDGLNGSTCNTQQASYAPLCTWFEGNTILLQQIQGLIDGSYSTATNGVPNPKPTQPVPALTNSAITTSVIAPGLLSTSVYGFINNSMMIQLPGQPGLAPLTFANKINFSVDPKPYYLTEQTFDCGAVKIIFFSFCLGRMMGNLFYNTIFRYIYNFFLTIFQQIINQVIMAFLMIPLQGMADIFKQGLQTVNAPGVNPVIALANMGVMYINFSANLWMMLLNLAITSAIIPIFGLFIFALIALAMPLLLAWIGIMVSVGFTTAYYVPMLPYMIFTFGSLAWLMSVIEAMVAAPLVALGVTHPEGHDAFGKGEHAIMILMNVFLRPAMMIIGYISAIALCYVGVWIINAGFDHAISFIQVGGKAPSADCNNAWSTCASNWSGSYGQNETPNWNNSLPTSGSGTGKYDDWAGIYAYFFSILIYTTMYLVVVQKSFNLIYMLPDKVLRWIGGSPESAGQDAASWGEDVKGKVGDAGKGTQDAQGQIGNKLGGYGQKALGSISKPGGGGGKVQTEGAEASPSPAPGGGGKKPPGGAGAQ